MQNDPRKRLALLQLGAIVIGGGARMPDVFGPVARKSPAYAVPPVHGRSPGANDVEVDKIPVPEKQGQEQPVNAPGGNRFEQIDREIQGPQLPGENRKQIREAAAPGPKDVGGPGTPVGTRKERRQAMKLDRMIKNREQAFQRTVAGFKREAEKARDNARGQDQDLFNALADRPDLVAAIQKTFKELIIRNPDWSRNKLMQVAAGRHGVVVAFTDKGKIGR